MKITKGMWISTVLALMVVLLTLTLAQREDKVTLALTGDLGGEPLYTVTSADRDGTVTSETTLRQASFNLERERLVTNFLIAELRLREYEGNRQRVTELEGDLRTANLKTRDLSRTIDMIQRY